MREIGAPAGGRAAWLAPVVIVVAIVATYWVVCTGEFTNWDDQVNVTNNPHLNPPTVEGLVSFWPHSYSPEYIPLSYTLWWLLARLAQLDAPDIRGIWLNPYVFHTANLLLHVAVCLAVYRLLRLLTGRAWPACAGALLFAMHPLQVEPVAWVTGLKDLTCGLLSMITLWQYVKFARADLGTFPATWEPDRRTPKGRFDNTSVHASGGGAARLPSVFGINSKHVHYAAATVALIGALLAKPTAISVPAIALVIDRILLGRSWRRIAMALLPWLLIAGMFAVMGVASQHGGEASDLRIWQRPLVAADSLAFYLVKLFLPVRLAALYPRSLPKVLESRDLWMAWMLPVALGALAWALRRRAPWLAAGALIFALAPLPVLGLARFHYQRLSTVADRYVYVAMLGPSLALAFGLGGLQSRKSMGAFCGALAAFGAVLLTLAMLSMRQARYWHDTTTLFTHVLTVDPASDVAYCDLASEALGYRRPAEAVELARKAFGLKPDRSNNGITLGMALQEMGKHAEARAAFLDVVRRDPTNVLALTNLASEFALAGRQREAIVFCRRALEIDPSFPDAHRDLAMLLSQQHQDQAAVTEAAAAVHFAPIDASNHRVYGRMLAAVGRQAEAEREFAEAKRLDVTSIGK